MKEPFDILEQEPDDSRKKLSSYEKTVVKDSLSFAQTSAQKLSKDLANETIEVEKMLHGLIHALRTADYLRTALYYIIPESEYRELPINGEGRKIEVSYQNDIVKVKIPHICPRNFIKNSDILPVRRQMQAVLSDFYDDFIAKRGKKYDRFVLLEKYVFEESFPKIRDLDRFTSSHLIDELVRAVSYDDGFEYMNKYIRTALKKGTERYTILYLTTPETYRKYEDMIEKDL